MKSDNPKLNADATLSETLRHIPIRPRTTENRVKYVSTTPTGNSRKAKQIFKKKTQP